MGSISHDVYKSQQEHMQTCANEQLAAQYRACGEEPPEFCKPQFIEGEFEVADEQKLIGVE
jgi:hypothetical protein